MLTTAGVTFSSIGASDGNGVPPTCAGNAAHAGAGRAAVAAWSTSSTAATAVGGSDGRAVNRRAVTPPPTAASSRQANNETGRIGFPGKWRGGSRAGPQEAGAKGRSRAIYSH